MSARGRMGRSIESGIAEVQRSTASPDPLASMHDFLLLALAHARAAAADDPAIEAELDGLGIENALRRTLYATRQIDQNRAQRAQAKGLH